LSILKVSGQGSKIKKLILDGVYRSLTQYWRKRLSKRSEQPGVFVPVIVSRSAPVRLLLGSQVAIELTCESLPDVLVALRDKGLLHASP
jgi:hypothetical protein